MTDIESKSNLKKLKESLITNPSREIKNIAGVVLVYSLAFLIASGIIELTREKTSNNNDKKSPQTEQSSDIPSYSSSVVEIKNQQVVVDDTGRKRTVSVENGDLILDGSEINDIRTSYEARGNGYGYPNAEYRILKILSTEKGAIEVQIKNTLAGDISSEIWLFHNGVLIRSVEEPSWQMVILAEKPNYSPTPLPTRDGKVHIIPPRKTPSKGY